MTSILVIRLTSLGDVILATPVIAALHEAYPEASIDVAVDASCAEVWQSNPHIRSVYSLRKGEDTIVVLPAYDLVVDLQKNRRSSRIVSCAQRSGSPRIVRYAKHRLEKLAFVYLKRKPDVTTHVVWRYEKPLEEFGLHIGEHRLALYGPSGAIQKTTFRVPGSKLRIGIAPGAKHETKRYPAQLMAQVVRRLVLDHLAEVVMIGGPADVGACDRIAEHAGVPVTRADGSTSLYATLNVLSGLDVLLSSDSAAVHMASACGLSVVVIYGSTAPEFGFTPYMVPHGIVEHQGLSCRPCTHIGRPSCPKGHFQCMNSIDPTVVVSEVIGLLND